MSPLRHPIEEIHDRFGKAGLIVALIALVAALGGTALAAKGAFTGKQKGEVTAIAKKFAGKDGAQGPQGLPGPAGKDGVNGTNGVNGKDGVNGESGKGVVVGTASPGECGLPGGSTVEVQGSGVKKAICNGHEGPEGEQGEQGEPGPVTEVLPAGVTVRGHWGHTDSWINPFREVIPVSFPFRVENSSGDGPTVHYIREMPSTGSFEITPSWSSSEEEGIRDTTVIGPAAGSGDITAGETEVANLSTTNGEFAIGQEIEGEGIPAETKIVAVHSVEHKLKLSAAATETKAGDALTGLPSRIVAWHSFQNAGGKPAVGDPISGPGIPAGTTITQLLRQDHFPFPGEAEISADPTAPGPAVTLTISDPPGCTGGSQNPGAQPGNVCIFVGAEETGVAEELGIGPFGYLLEGRASADRTGFEVEVYAASEVTNEFDLQGSWAVTGF